MDFSGIFARLVEGIGAAMIQLRRMDGGPREQAVGNAPTIPVARPQGALPTLKMPTARGWTAGQTPIPAPGLKVNAFAAGLKHPRWIQGLPNGDVLVAEALTLAGPIRSVFDYAMTSSCYDPTNDGAGCGQCDSCLLRLRGFAEFGVSDPLRYQIKGG